jgi:hypothetical protein
VWLHKSVVERLRVQILDKLQRQFGALSTVHGAEYVSTPCQLVMTVAAFVQFITTTLLDNATHPDLLPMFRDPDKLLYLPSHFALGDLFARHTYLVVTKAGIAHFRIDMFFVSVLCFDVCLCASIMLI